ncbi:MAG TPA: DUF3455 domain-containing protein [Polyangiaceae bacterium]|nr:DUF3455 domain-containing protein [Polyangiaceae bacterium]
MNHSKLVVCFGISVGLLVSGCAAAPQATEEITTSEEALSPSLCPEGVPPELAPAADQTIKASLTGVGVQIYICNAKTTGFGWSLVAPQANLLDDCDKLVGTHFIGPTWQGNDGSSVAGARVAGVTVDPSAIPWLLLKATSNGPIAGKFSDVTSIQRLNTVGGLAPSTPCDANNNLGSIVQVPYTAQYVFYKTKTHGKVVQCNGS